MKKGAYYFRLLTKEEQQRIIQDIGSDDIFLANELEYKSFQKYIWGIYKKDTDINYYFDLITKYTDIESRINHDKRLVYNTVSANNVKIFKHLLITLKDNSFLNISKHMGLSLNQVSHISSTLNKWKKLK